MEDQDQRINIETWQIQLKEVTIIYPKNGINIKNS